METLDKHTRTPIGKQTHIFAMLSIIPPRNRLPLTKIDTIGNSFIRAAYDSCARCLELIVFNERGQQREIAQ